MRVLVTGGAGFIGSHFIRQWLARHPEAAVTNLDALTYAGSRARLADIPEGPRYRWVQADVTDAAAVQQALAGCDAVAHFAAETHVDRSIVQAAPFLRTNVEGTGVVLAAARAAGVSRVLHVSTDEVYGPVLKGAADEQAPLSPRSPYAASKAAGDLLAQAYHATHGLPVIVARPTNIYGPWQLPEKFMPLCITQALAGQPIPLYGDGQQRRGWLAVADACAALALLLERGNAGEVYNVGSGHEQANQTVAEALLDAVGAPRQLLRRVEDRPGHDRRYALDDAKLRALGWRPQTGWEEGLAENVAWYRAHEAWWRPLAAQLKTEARHWLPAGR